MAYKVTTGHTTFQLMFGMEACMPSEHELPSLQIAVQYHLTLDATLVQQLRVLTKIVKV